MEQFELLTSGMRLIDATYMSEATRKQHKLYAALEGRTYLGEVNSDYIMFYIPDRIFVHQLADARIMVTHGGFTWFYVPATDDSYEFAGTLNHFGRM